MNYYIVAVPGELPTTGSLSKAKKIKKSTVKALTIACKDSAFICKLGKDASEADRFNELSRRLELFYATMEDGNA